MVTLVVCGILECEVKKALQNLGISLPVKILPAELHLYPSRLKEQLIHQLEEITDSKIVVYGNCFPGIDDVCSMYHAERIQGENCYDIVAGEKFYQLLKEEPGTYFLLPALCERFEELTKELDIERTKEVLFKNYKRCVLLDTGVARSTCVKPAEALGLPFCKEYVGTQILEEKLKKLMSNK